MIGEVWQLLVAGVVAIVAIILWVFLIYLPRRSWDGDKKSGPKDKD